METQTADELVLNLEAKVDEAVTLVRSESRAIEKELRQFETKLLFTQELGVLTTWFETPIRFISCGTHCVLNGLQKLLTRTICGEEGVLFPKPSMRSKGLTDDSKSLFDITANKLRLMSADRRIGSLRELSCLLDCRREFDIATVGDFSECLWARDLLDVLRSDLPDPSQLSDYLKSWPKKEGASIHEKLYVSRGERRAFVSDKLELRALVGSIIHRLLLPKSKHARCQFSPYNESMPEQKHVFLNYEIDLQPHESALLLFGDISSFTSSFKNIWPVLIALTLSLERNKRDKLIIISIKGQLLEVGLLEVLRLFLYLSSVVEVKNGNERFISIGGMLGIAGIDTLAKTIFALFLQNLCRSLPVKAIPRVGGDDFFIAIVFNRNKITDAWRSMGIIRDTITERIGRLKTLDEMHCDETMDQIVPYTYCKKHVRVRLDRSAYGDGRLLLMSQYPIPLLSQFFDKPSVWDELDTINFISSLKHLPWVQDREYLQSVIYTAAIIRHRVSRPGMRLANYREEPPPPTDCGFSAIARDLIEKVTSLSTADGELYRTSLWLKAQAVDPRRLRVVEYRNGEESKIITMSSSEPFMDRSISPPVDEPSLLDFSNLHVQRFLIMARRLEIAAEGGPG